MGGLQRYPTYPLKTSLLFGGKANSTYSHHPGHNFLRAFSLVHVWSHVQLSDTDIYGFLSACLCLLYFFIWGLWPEHVGDMAPTRSCLWGALNKLLASESSFPKLPVLLSPPPPYCRPLLAFLCALAQYPQLEAALQFFPATFFVNLCHWSGPFLWVQGSRPLPSDTLSGSNLRIWSHRVINMGNERKKLLSNSHLFMMFSEGKKFHGLVTSSCDLHFASSVCWCKAFFCVGVF